MPSSPQLLEDEGDRLLIAAIRTFVEVWRVGFQESNGRRDEELAPLRIRAARFHRSLAQLIEFVFGQTAFQPEQQTVVT